jgi:hypothetical protein
LTVNKVYKVTFVADGEVVAQKTVNQGETLTDIPEIPSKAGYDETAPHWDLTDFGSISEDTTVTAVYTVNTEKYDDGTAADGIINDEAHKENAQSDSGVAPSESKSDSDIVSSEAKSDGSVVSSAENAAKAPQTGDNSSAALCVTLIAVSGSTIFAIIRKKARKHTAV